MSPISLVAAPVRDRSDPVAEGARDAAVPIAMMAPGRPRLPMLPGRVPFAVCIAVPTGCTFDAGAIEVGGRQDERKPWLLQDHVRPSQRRLRGEHEGRGCQGWKVSVHAIIPVMRNGPVIRSMVHLIERSNSAHSFTKAKTLPRRNMRFGKDVPPVVVPKRGVRISSIASGLVISGTARRSTADPAEAFVALHQPARSTLILSDEARTITVQLKTG